MNRRRWAWLAWLTLWVLVFAVPGGILSAALLADGRAERVRGDGAALVQAGRLSPLVAEPAAYDAEDWVRAVLPDYDDVLARKVGISPELYRAFAGRLADGLEDLWWPEVPYGHRTLVVKYYSTVCGSAFEDTREKAWALDLARGAIANAPIFVQADHFAEQLLGTDARAFADGFGE